MRGVFGGDVCATGASEDARCCAEAAWADCSASASDGGSGCGPAGTRTLDARLCAFVFVLYDDSLGGRLLLVSFSFAASRANSNRALLVEREVDSSEATCRGDGDATYELVDGDTIVVGERLPRLSSDMTASPVGTVASAARGDATTDTTDTLIEEEGSWK